MKTEAKLEYESLRFGAIAVDVSSLGVRLYICTQVQNKWWLRFADLILRTINSSFFPFFAPFHKWKCCCLVNDQRDAQILFYVFISIYNSLHVSNTSCSSSGETNCINTSFGNGHSMLVAERCAGWKCCGPFWENYCQVTRVTNTRLLWRQPFAVMWT